MIWLSLTWLFSFLVGWDNMVCVLLLLAFGACGFHGCVVAVPLGCVS